jgi:hypothetical protein
MDFFRVALALVTVFGLLGSLYLFSSRLKKRIPIALGESGTIWSGKFRVTTGLKNSTTLQVRRRIHLTATHQLHLISASDEEFLLCTHPQGCTVLRTPSALLSDTQPTAASERIEPYAS